MCFRALRFPRFDRRFGLRWSGAAFTLIELLVIVAILGLLAAVLVPVLSQARHKRWEAGCLANLRQTGLALNMWVDDNNGWLPPGAGSADGLLMEQTYGYRETPLDHARLVYYLAPYLGASPPDGVDRVVGAFICPGSQRPAEGATNATGRVYYGLCGQGTGNLPAAGTGLPFAPFGYPGWAGTPEAPHKLADVQLVRSLTEVWTLCDIDGISFPAPAGGWIDQVPERPAHGSVRNYLFFDGHAATKQIAPAGRL